jgi:flagellar protein FliO/FliZ
VNEFLAVAVVLGLVGVLAWMARRGTFQALQSRNRMVSVDTAVPLGERRSVIVVSVDGRRLLLGLTPQQITLLAELSATAPGSEPAR